MVWFMGTVIQPIEGLLAEVLEAWDQLGPREQRALTLIANRLLMGQKAYGELTHGKKDWKKEASEEAFDMAVYLSALLVDMEDDSEPVTERNP